MAEYLLKVMLFFVHRAAQTTIVTTELLLTIKCPLLKTLSRTTLTFNSQLQLSFPHRVLQND